MRRLAATLALLLVARPAVGQALACDTGAPEVRGVSFTGNAHFGDSELAAAIVTTPSSWFRRVLGIPIGARRCVDSVEVQRDAIRLRLFYRQRGYYETTVAPDIQAVAPGAVHVAFRIGEGAPVRIDTLRIGGLDSVRPRLRARLEGLLAPLRGAVYDKLRLQSAIDSVVTVLANEGYAHATQPLRDITVNNASNTAEVKLTFLPGAVAHIGRIDFEILPNPPARRPAIDTETVHELLSFNVGDLYRQRDILRTQRDLYGLETYRHVDVQLLADSLQPNDTSLTVRVLLGEAPMQSMRVGVGWANLDCLRTQARYTDRNFLGGARRLELAGRLAHLALCESSVRNDSISDVINYSLNATLRLPTLFGPRNVPSFSLYSERTSEFRTYRRYTPVGVGAQVTRDLAPRDLRPGLPVTVAYSFEYGRTEAAPAVFCQVFNRCTLADIAQLQRNSDLQVATLAVLRDRTDNLLDPSMGSQLRLELRFGSTSVDRGSASRFDRVLGEAAFYEPVGSSTLAARLQVGAVLRGFSLAGATGYVPPQERLYAGGPNSVRGYNQNLLGPIVYIVDSASVRDSVAPDGRHVYQASDTATIRQYSPTGGNMLAVANVEWRAPSPVWSDVLQLAAFVDAGLVWNRPKETVTLSDVKVTPGIGIRLNSPVGPFRVDVAYNQYPLSPGAVYYLDRTSELLRCVSPGNTFDRGEVVPGDECPASFRPAQRRALLSRLTFNFSIGQAF